jgi:hypothetical protein
MKAATIKTLSSQASRYYAAQKMLTPSGLIAKPCGFGNSEHSALMALQDRKELAYSDCKPAGPVCLYKYIYSL